MRKILLALSLLLLSTNAMAEDKAFDRIVKNKEINCGVYVLGSIFSYDVKGKPTGFTVDLMDEISFRTNLKVKYTEISSFATVEQDMKTAKFDMMCAPVLLFPPTSMRFLPSPYITKDEINIYAAGSHVLSELKDASELNDPKYTFIGMDGELGGMYAPKYFPKAKLKMLPLGVPHAQMIMEVEAKKADFVLLTHIAAQAVLKDNPNKIKKIATMPSAQPSVHLFYPLNGHNLKANIDAILEQLMKDGTMKKLLKKHNLEQ